MLKSPATLDFTPLLLLLLSVASFVTTSLADEILVADRLTNSVYRYSTTGSLLGILLQDNTNLNQPAGLQVSPDGQHLFVASSQNNSVVRYDYDDAAATATNATVFADASDGLMFPNSIIFNSAGDRMYVSNLGGSGIAQFHLDGTAAGSPVNGTVGGGAFFQYSGLAFAPDGDLLVGGFQDFPAGTSGAIARSDAAVASLSDFIVSAPSLNGVGNLLVAGNSLYATAGFAGRLNKYDATTGAVDASFPAVTGLAFPASMISSPDGNGVLVGILGFANGTGNITHFGADGSTLGVFAHAQTDPALGFMEATGMAFVTQPIPEPALGTCVCLCGAFWLRRRMRPA